MITTSREEAAMPAAAALGALGTGGSPRRR